MNRALIVLIVAVFGIAVWTYKGIHTFQAYQEAVAELANRHEITEALGEYEVNYDWWYGAFRALRHGKVQEFEFHLDGRRATAVAAVNLRRDSGWEITCVNVVTGEYLNKHLIRDC